MQLGQCLRLLMQKEIRNSQQVISKMLQIFLRKKSQMLVSLINKGSIIFEANYTKVRNY